ncbi:hypothetical protein BD413DRAFT_609702 [Trametes elegans]|nr:hypothetical protein BD413DRAFT_609702 [Trametes elegans]
MSPHFCFKLSTTPSKMISLCGSKRGHDPDPLLVIALLVGLPLLLVLLLEARRAYRAPSRDAKFTVLQLVLFVAVSYTAVSFKVAHLGVQLVLLVYYGDSWVRGLAMLVCLPLLLSGVPRTHLLSPLVNPIQLWVSANPLAVEVAQLKALVAAKHQAYVQVIQERNALLDTKDTQNAEQAAASRDAQASVALTEAHLRAQVAETIRLLEDARKTICEFQTAQDIAKIQDERTQVELAEAKALKETLQAEKDALETKASDARLEVFRTNLAHRQEKEQWFRTEADLKFKVKQLETANARQRLELEHKDKIISARDEDAAFHHRETELKARIQEQDKEIVVSLKAQNALLVAQVRENEEESLAQLKQRNDTIADLQAKQVARLEKRHNASSPKHADASLREVSVSRLAQDLQQRMAKVANVQTRLPRPSPVCGLKVAKGQQCKGGNSTSTVVPAGRVSSKTRDSEIPRPRLSSLPAAIPSLPAPPPTITITPPTPVGVKKQKTATPRKPVYSAKRPPTPHRPFATKPPARSTLPGIPRSAPSSSEEPYVDFADYVPIPFEGPGLPMAASPCKRARRRPGTPHRRPLAPVSLNAGN